MPARWLLDLCAHTRRTPPCPPVQHRPALLALPARPRRANPRTRAQYAIFLAVVLVIYLVYSCASSLALEEHSALRKGRTNSFDRVGGSVVRVLSQGHGPSLQELGPGDNKALEGTKAVQLV